MCVSMCVFGANLIKCGHSAEREREVLYSFMAIRGEMFRLRWLTQLSHISISHVEAGQVCLHSNVIN